MSDNWGNEFAALISSAQETFLNGIVTGKPIGVSVELIIEPAVAFGRRRAEDSDYYPYRYTGEDRAALARDATGRTIESIFSGKSLQSAVENILISASAFGFAERRAEIAVVEAEVQRKIDADQALYGGISAAYDAIMAEIASGQVSAATVDLFFREVNAINDKGSFEIVLNRFVQPVLTNDAMRKIAATITKSKAYDEFSNYYSRMLFGDIIR